MTQYSVALSCSYCDSTHFIRFGKSKGIQRYRCKVCKRTFKDTTSSPMHWLHKKTHVKKYLEALKLGLSVRKAALFAGISKNTSFQWRHKFLSSVSVRTKPAVLNQSVGAMLIRLPFSNKGQNRVVCKKDLPTCSLLVLGEEGCHLKELGERRLGYQISCELLKLAPAGYIAPVKDNVLSRMLNKHSENRIISNNEAREELCEKVKSFAGMLEDWMSRFRGVASKYLQQYWSWFSFIKLCDDKQDGGDMFFKGCVRERSLKVYREFYK